MALIVDKHPQRQLIIDGILAGRSLRAISASITPTVSAMALQRYKSLIMKPVLMGKSAPISIPIQHVAGDSVQSVTRAVTVAESSPVRDRVQATWDRIDRGLSKAEARGEDIALSPLLSQAHKNIELLGTLTGELQQAGSASIQVQLVISTSAAEQPEEFEGTTIDIRTK